jgi:hypothetical protein
MISLSKYRVARFGNHCFCLTTSDLMNAVIEPVSDEDLKKEINTDAVNVITKTNTAKDQASQTEKAFLMNAKQAQSVRPEKVLSPGEVNQALWTEQSPGLGFFGFCVFFTIIYLIAVPALG